jgi:hypothetical protein
MTAFNAKAIQAELRWLKDNPWFDQKPASIEEFLGFGVSEHCHLGASRH